MYTATNHELVSDNESKSFEAFLTKWQETYINRAATIPLFKRELAEQLSRPQQKYFAEIFYHARGHFHEFLWYLGNYAPDNETKQIILKNIAEEFGGNAPSHELLYINFAKSLGANVSKKSHRDKFYLPFLKKFNDGHCTWLENNSWQGNICAFSAYEKLDNIDYVNLYQLAEVFNLPKTALIFFNVHIHVTHFETTLEYVKNIWETNPCILEEAYSFIANHQIDMWQKLSQAVFDYNEIYEVE